ncbi:Protein S-acyltransferase 10 [Zostera marina]|uniref:S-acyltransferase n=1 Tax=Zostera marina TaxID=29655 RepID=A0A0K9Q566_ZOSMR|nr:Protein S-acyltransferase 10 [Zostera marina]
MDITAAPNQVSDFLVEAQYGIADRFLLAFPCLSDPVRRTSLFTKSGLIIFHFVSVGFLFAFDGSLLERTKKEPWYTVLLLSLFVTTVFQYIFTSVSSPGYTKETMNTGDVTYAGCTISCKISIENGNLVRAWEYGRQPGGDSVKMDSESLSKLLMELYPGGINRNWTCDHCKYAQPPRAKHCHDCGKCVLKFDHHCVWLGTCIGQKNHCRFWWYLFEETILCTWAVILYIPYLKNEAHLSWWKETAAIIILLLLIFSLVFLVLLLFFHSYLIITNQTTYELVRRRRISYMRYVPENVMPFSKGICRNLYEFCCSWDRGFSLDALPTNEEMAVKTKPYTCLDVISCRCC